MYPVDLRGDRVVLREYRADDVTAIRVYAEDPEVHRYTLWQVDRYEDTVAWLHTVDQQARAPERKEYELAITLADTGELIGGVALHLYGVRNGLGYLIRRDRWGAGLVTEAASLLITLGFDRLGLEHIFSHVEPRNAGSIRVLEKLGMRREGLVLRHHLVAGTWRDSYQYAVVRGEWDVLRRFAPRARGETGFELRLERAHPARIEEVHELMRVVGKDMLDRLGMDHWSEPFPLEDMRADARRRETHNVYSTDGALVASFTIGFQSQWLNEETLPWAPAARPLWLNRIMVHPAHQGTGLGRVLMLTIEDLARARGCDAVRLETRTDFDDVQRFYKRLGYVERYIAPASERWSSWNALEKTL